MNELNSLGLELIGQRHVQQAGIETGAAQKAIGYAYRLAYEHRKEWWVDMTLSTKR